MLKDSKGSLFQIFDFVDP
jgi:hypothetical protein